MKQVGTKKRSRAGATKDGAALCRVRASAKKRKISTLVPAGDQVRASTEAVTAAGGDAALTNFMDENNGIEFVSEMQLDRVPCPHCLRRFNAAVAERHIPKCQELKTKPRAIAPR